MKLLLDTHTLYWYVEDDPKLSSTAQSLIRDASNEVYVSPASYWEMAIKVSLGKWIFHRPYEEFMDMVLNAYGFQIFHVLPTHTAQLIAMPFHHNDPFDRLLVAQALAESIPVVSIDGHLDSYGITRLW